MNRQPLWTIALVLPLLGGCKDTTVTLGMPPPVRLTELHQRVPLPIGLPVGESTGEALRQAIGRLGTPVGIDVTIFAGDLQAAQVRALLLGQGVDPDRIRHDVAETRDASVLLTRTIALTHSCDLAIARSGDPSLSLDSLGQCIQQQNLVDMLADPRDLVQPPPLEAAPAAQAVKAIEDLYPASHDQDGNAGAATSSPHP